ncbi:sn-1-specific diacylglycerol lipase ABHD11-like isoform X1 [Centruroides vittatus]|uniref:sn-1-specific diacylglycerol lipase ABHD11-like isoform X1 n=2 Tax=Centruroides vittatus TaxID=120091 RepID=UPI00350E9EA3
MNSTVSEDTIDLSFEIFDGTDEMLPPTSPVVIVHGVFDCKENWQKIAENIADKSVKKVFVIDLRNHGDSGKSEDFSYSAMYRDLEKFIRMLKEPVILIGHSLGSTVTMGFALKQPDMVNMLISVDITPLDYPMDTETRILGALMKVKEALRSIPQGYLLSKAKKFLENQFEKNNLVFALRKIFTSTLVQEGEHFKFKTNLDAVEEHICNRKTIRKTYPLSGFYKNPVLVVYGEKSNYVTSKDYNAMKTIFPNVSLTSIKDSSHWIHIEKPDDLFNAILSFLSSKN